MSDPLSTFLVETRPCFVSDLVDQCRKYKAMMENQLNAKIKCIRTDHGEVEDMSRFRHSTLDHSPVFTTTKRIGLTNESDNRVASKIHEQRHAS